LAEKDGVAAGETHQTIEATFRIERARLIAGLARMVRNVDLAEELAQDALVVALSEWPRTGVRANPGASGYSSHRHGGAVCGQPHFCVTAGSCYSEGLEVEIL
jgi:DNA-directed RNA polymerase specialized sigma24 family protein